MLLRTAQLFNLRPATDDSDVDFAEEQPVLRDSWNATERGREGGRVGDWPHGEIEDEISLIRQKGQAARERASIWLQAHVLDRKSVVSGKRVSVRVELGGQRLIKKQKTQKN